MFTINITSDIADATKEVDDFFRRQLRYVMMRSINDTAVDVQSHLRTVTIPAATPRNKSLARAMTYMIADEKSGQNGLFRTQNFLKSKDTIVIGPVRDGKTGYQAGEGFAERQVTGQTKTPRHSAVAIPVIGPGLKRLAGGSIPKAKKPKNLRGNDKFFVKDSKIFERMGAKGEKIRLRYVLAAQAKGTHTYAKIYPDAFDVVNRVFSGHFEREMTAAIAKSRFANAP